MLQMVAVRGLCLLKAKSFLCSCPDGLHPSKDGNATKYEGKAEEGDI